MNIERPENQRIARIAQVKRSLGNYQKALNWFRIQNRASEAEWKRLRAEIIRLSDELGDLLNSDQK